MQSVGLPTGHAVRLLCRLVVMRICSCTDMLGCGQADVRLGGIRLKGMWLCGAWCFGA